MFVRESVMIGGRALTLETGRLAKQAHGAVVVAFGDSVTLTAAVEGEADPGRDYFPLVVDYREKTYAAGKFPGGFIKREGRPTTKEILTARLCDRPIRPLFPAGYINEVQIQGIVLSADKLAKIEAVDALVMTADQASISGTDDAIVASAAVVALFDSTVSGPAFRSVVRRDGVIFAVPNSGQPPRRNLPIGNQILQQKRSPGGG